VSENWREISSNFPGRGTKQVIAHWRKVADPEIVRGSWTVHEDLAIIGWVMTHGPKKWPALASQMPGRIAHQCRERWRNHLDPAVMHDHWTDEEDQLIITAVHQLGQKWAYIAKLLGRRTDNAVKNRWNSTLKKRGPTHVRVGPDVADAFPRQHRSPVGLPVQYQPRYVIPQLQQNVRPPEEPVFPPAGQ
jgi:hypothetical protein